LFPQQQQSRLLLHGILDDQAHGSTKTSDPHASPVPTTETTFICPGEASIPVLLYHHVMLETKEKRYAVGLEFKAFEYLKDQGFQMITLRNDRSRLMVEFT
jgi:hypothetical protein